MVLFLCLTSSFSFTIFLNNLNNNLPPDQSAARGDDGLTERILASVVAAQRFPRRHTEYAEFTGQHSGARLVRWLHTKGVYIDIDTLSLDVHI